MIDLFVHFAMLICDEYARNLIYWTYNPSICLSLKDLRPSLWLCFYSEVGFFQPGNYFHPALFLLHPSRAHSLPVGPLSFFLPVLSQISRKVIPFYAPYDPRWTTIRLQIIEYFDWEANKSREGKRKSLKVCQSLQRCIQICLY